MDTGYLKLIELVLLVGGLLAFGFWQLRSVDRDRRRRLEAEAKAAAEAAAAAEVREAARPPADRAPDSD
jgi:hypothetical protein